MRRYSRIKQFFELINLDYLTERWNLTRENVLVANEPLAHEWENPLSYIDWRIVRTYWELHHDMRIGQVLINLQFITDSLVVWNDEEYNILYDQGIHPREITTWVSYFDKDKNLLEEPVEKYVKDLDTDHINKIIPLLSEANIFMLDVLNNELKLRNEEAEA